MKIDMETTELAIELTIGLLAYKIKQEILGNGHGGGNWRRVVEQVCDKYIHNATK